MIFHVHMGFFPYLYKKKKWEKRLFWVFWFRGGGNYVGFAIHQKQSQYSLDFVCYCRRFLFCQKSSDGFSGFFCEIGREISVYRRNTQISRLVERIETDLRLSQRFESGFYGFFGA